MLNKQYLFRFNKMLFRVWLKLASRWKYIYISTGINMCYIDGDKNVFLLTCQVVEFSINNIEEHKGQYNWYQHYQERIETEICKMSRKE